MGSPFRLRDDGLDLFVRLTPRAAHDAVEGAEATADGRFHLKVRLRAVPEKGKANAALEKLLARTLGVSVFSVSVVAGATTRLKTVRITGNPSILTPRIAVLGALRA